MIEITQYQTDLSLYLVIFFAYMLSDGTLWEVHTAL